MAARTSSPTISNSKSFLAKAWEARKELLDKEKRGFAQFFYLTLCGHIESELSKVICLRLFFIRRGVNWEDAPPVIHSDNGTDQECSNGPLAASIRQMAEKLEAEVESAPLLRLIDIFSRVFPENLQDILGSELSKDMLALGAIRNVFAHGRNLIMDFEDGEDLNSFKGTLDRNPLQKPAERLKLAGIIENLDINLRNIHDFHSKFYGDEAMLYFYRAAQSIETKLGSFSTYLPEQNMSGLSTLPPLGP
ncbi:MAG: hypothetical protein KKH12_13995 [Gammaproteobacteria bacterium]|nr:hypothetical protein [Gammaproteobacteria bacterium]MBU1482772.1 hypothetical protein [Gammaproteobacteria bacterium]